MGETLGKYEIQDRLGQGAMGVVYKAWDTSLNRTVALKTMVASLASDPELKERFYREARAAAQLQHPNIITIFELGEIEGKLYIAMEFIEGKNFDELITEPASLDRKINVMIQICRALCFAHQHGIVHRDVKPSNIYVRNDGTVKILDFGIAHLANSELTKTGSAMGTPEYMSPELIQGAKVDHRSDIFSCGVIFYEYLTGQEPFRDESMPNLLYKIITEDPPPVSDFVPDAPPLVSRLVSHMLAKKPEDRYQDLNEAIDDLNDLQSELFLVKAEKVRELKKIYAQIEKELRKIREDRINRLVLERKFGSQLSELKERIRHTSNPSDTSVTLDALLGEITFLKEFHKQVSSFLKEELPEQTSQLRELGEQFEEHLKGSRLEEAGAALEQIRELAGPRFAGEYSQRLDEALREAREKERQEKIQNYLARARKRLERSELRSALGNTEEALALDPKLQEAVQLKAEIQQKIKEQEERLRSPQSPPSPESIPPPSSPQASSGGHPGSRLIENIVSEFFDQARTDYGQGALDKCRENLNRVLELQPAHSGALELLNSLDSAPGSAADSESTVFSPAHGAGAYADESHALPEQPLETAPLEPQPLWARLNLEGPLKWVALAAVLVLIVLTAFLMLRGKENPNPQASTPKLQTRPAPVTESENAQPPSETGTEPASTGSAKQAGQAPSSALSSGTSSSQTSVAELKQKIQAYLKDGRYFPPPPGRNAWDLLSEMQLKSPGNPEIVALRYRIRGLLEGEFKRALQKRDLSTAKGILENLKYYFPRGTAEWTKYDSQVAQLENPVPGQAPAKTTQSTGTTGNQSRATTTAEAFKRSYKVRHIHADNGYCQGELSLIGRTIVQAGQRRLILQLIRFSGAEHPIAMSFKIIKKVEFTQGRMTVLFLDSRNTYAFTNPADESAVEDIMKNAFVEK